MTRLWSTGFDLPHAARPGAAGASDLVQAADPDVLVAELGSLGRFCVLHKLIRRRIVFLLLLPCRSHF